MGRSFYLTNNYSVLRNASQTFSDLISATPLAFGLSAPIALVYKNLNDDFSAKFALADAPETRTKVTILDRNNAADDLKAKAAELAKTIYGTPTVTDGQKAALGLSVRATPEPVGAPGTAYDFKATLQGNGWLELGWKCANPKGARGTIYQVFRRTTAGGEFTHIGDSGEKSFTDTALPAGVTSVTYQVRAIRSTVAGGWAEFNVNFGMGGSGGMAATVSTPKLAA